jgi:hypothetical protein
METVVFDYYFSPLYVWVSGCGLGGVDIIIRKVDKEVMKKYLYPLLDVGKWGIWREVG